MEFGIRTLDEAELAGKTVLCRVDINQPVDRASESLRSINRIRACVPTVRELSDRGARVVLLAHQGSDIEYQNYYTTRPHRAVLEQLLERPVQWIDDVCGPAAREKIRGLKDGEILLLDNVRFLAEEQTLFEMKLRLTHEQQAKTLLVEKLAPLADLYVCDAFAAAHRDQPSLCGFEQVLPSYMGRLFQKEYCTVSRLMEMPDRPCLFVLGGAKVSDAFGMLPVVLSKGIADRVVTGGLVGNIFLAALGRDIGSGSRSFLERSNNSQYLEAAKALYERYGDKILLPRDLAWVEDGCRKEAHLGEIPGDITSTDIGSATAEAYRREILRAKTVFVNGPMGVFEQESSAAGTKTVWQALADTEGFTVLGGGDSITATESYGLTQRMGYLCTGGGALIRFLSGEELPVVRALRHGADVTKQ
ncbi:MAG: phosphoglycerate kinase [Eubacteriales bacterium]|nr:phosphoglycerate kinase [Eubacteriales bacterium]